MKWIVEIILCWADQTWTSILLEVEASEQDLAELKALQIVLDNVEEENPSNKLLHYFVNFIKRY